MQEKIINLLQGQKGSMVVRVADSELKLTFESDKDVTLLLHAHVRTLGWQEMGLDIENG